MTGTRPDEIPVLVTLHPRTVQRGQPDVFTACQTEARGEGIIFLVEIVAGVPTGRRHLPAQVVLVRGIAPPHADVVRSGHGHDNLDELVVVTTVCAGQLRGLAVPQLEFDITVLVLEQAIDEYALAARRHLDAVPVLVALHPGAGPLRQPGRRRQAGIGAGQGVVLLVPVIDRTGPRRHVVPPQVVAVRGIAERDLEIVRAVAHHPVDVLVVVGSGR